MLFKGLTLTLITIREKNQYAEDLDLKALVDNRPCCTVCGDS